MTSLIPLFRNRARVFVVLAVLIPAGIYILLGERPSTVFKEVAALDEAGKKSDYRHDVAIGLWFAAAINFLLGLALFFTAKWWNRPVDAPPIPESPKVSRGFWIAVGIAVVLGGALRWNLARGSLWWDELWNIKHTTVGYFRPDTKKDGELTFRKNSWSKTIWNYRKPTNHPPMSAASRVCLGTWRALSGGEPGSFSPFAARLPSLLAGLASIVCIALLLRRWGFIHAGVVAAFLLAVHPWQIRYGVDARAYSFAVLFTILACLWLSQAIETGKWRHWALFGFAQLMLTWGLPIGVWYSLAFFISGAVWIVLKKKESGSLSALGRLLAANVFAGMAFIQVFLPNALQLMKWGTVNDYAFLSRDRLAEALGQITFGMAQQWPETVEGEGLASLANVPGPLLAFMHVFIAVALCLGAFVLARKHRPGAVLFFNILTAALVYLLITWKAQHHFYPRYLIYLSVPLIACVAIGLSVYRRAFQVPAVLFIIGFLAVSWPQIRVLNSRSYAPFSEVAQLLRNTPKTQVVGYGLGGRMLQVVHPSAEFANNLDQLEPFVEHARTTGEPLHVVYGYREFNRSHPEVGTGFKRIDDPALFEQIGGFPGIEDLFYFRVLKFRGAGHTPAP